MKVIFLDFIKFLMGKKINKLVYWTPRILSIIFILFLTLFSFDVIEPGLTFWQIIGGLFMHNIPVFILIIALLISWKYEIVGGIVFILAGLLFIWLTIGRNEFEWYLIVWIIQISGPAFLIGILFFIGWFQKNGAIYKKH